MSDTSYRKIESQQKVLMNSCMGERFIGNGMKEDYLELHGTAGNVLGGFLDGGTIELYGNAQECVGNTMSGGKIIIHGNCGDTAGYGMRGGTIYVKGNIGSRGGIHMKQYQEHCPVLVVGGCAKDFLGEYLSGGIIIILNLDHQPFPVGKYCGSGAHGGEIYLRLDDKEQVEARSELQLVEERNIKKIEYILNDWSTCFQVDEECMYAGKYYKVKMLNKNPYEGYYVTD